MDIITPKILKGTRDFLPKDMAKRNFVLEKIKMVFSCFGYGTIDTPAIEYAETLLGKYGEEGAKLVYSFKDNGGRSVALRYDQTVPFARFVSQYYPLLVMPFKRYQISKVWRADKPAQGRYREFTQCDVDIVGTKNILSEGEIAAVIYNVFSELGFDNFVIKFNSRILINNILKNFEIPNLVQIEVMKSLDKFMKVGVEGLKKELQVVLSSEKIEQLLSCINLQGSNEDKLNKLSGYNIGEIKDFLDVCDKFGIPNKNIDFDPSLVRGLDYYTGLVFEVYIKDLLEIGAVCSGGRYDNLCSLFSSKQLSGVGVSFGFDRILLAMEKFGLIPEVTQSSEVLVTYFNNDMLSEIIGIASDLRKAGIKTEIYFEPQKLDKQIKYADKNNIPYVIIFGPDEEKEDKVVLKIMESRRQESLSRQQLVSYLIQNKKF